MNKFNNPLERVSVAAPCSANWDEMSGDDRARFCRECNLHVYNLSGMTKREAENLVRQAEGQLCVRFYRRADGSILTQNCPTGLRAIKRRLSRAATATLASVLGFFAGVGAYAGLLKSEAIETAGAMRIEEPMQLVAPISELTPEAITRALGKIEVRPDELHTDPRSIIGEVTVMGEMRPAETYPPPSKARTHNRR